MKEVLHRLVSWMDKLVNVPTTGYAVEGKSLKSFYREIIRHPLFYFPFLSLSIMAYLPSITNTKRQFEDFHTEYYIGDHGVMRTGRWWMWLEGRAFHLPGNDIANKYLCLLFLILGALMITAAFYCLSRKKGVFKYTVLAVTIVIFPLINEIWSYNGANLIVCQNYLLCGWVIYYLLCVRDHGLKRLVLASIPFVLIASSYESGLFLYITLVFGVLFYLCVAAGLRFKQYFSAGVVFAAPLMIGTVAGVAIGYMISLAGSIPYDRHGDTSPHWLYGIGSALRDVVFGNLDRYFLRALVYVPIAVFVLAVGLLLIYLVMKVFAGKQGMVILSGAAFFLSVFLLSALQGSYLTYRSSQNVTVFIAVTFFLILETCGEYRKLPQKCFAALMLLVCLMESSCLLKINLTDYQSAHNDEDLVRQIGYELTAHYYGKPVIFINHIYDGYSLYSRQFHRQVTVDTSKWNGRTYSRLRERIIGESAEGLKIYDTNLWSVLFLADRESDSLEQFFDYCGFDIDVIPYTNFWPEITASHPEVIDMMMEGSLHRLEFVDMGEYVIVAL